MEIGGWGLSTLAEGLPTRWRALYDDYGPVRPGPFRRSAVPSAEPPTTPAIARLRLQRGNPAPKLAASAAHAAKTPRCQVKEACVRQPPKAVSALSFPVRPVVSGLGVSLSHFSFSVWPSGL